MRLFGVGQKLLAFTLALAVISLLTMGAPPGNKQSAQSATAIVKVTHDVGAPTITATQIKTENTTLAPAVAYSAMDADAVGARLPERRSTAETQTNAGFTATAHGPPIV